MVIILRSLLLEESRSTLSLFLNLMFKFLRYERLKTESLCCRQKVVIILLNLLLEEYRSILSLFLNLMPKL